MIKYSDLSDSWFNTQDERFYITPSMLEIDITQNDKWMIFENEYEFFQWIKKMLSQRIPFELPEII